MQPARSFPRVDYANHLAFPDARPDPDASAAVDEQIAAIDALLDPIRSGAQPMPADSERAALEAAVDRHLDEIAALGRASTGDHPVMAAALEKAIAFTRPELLEEALFSNERAGSPPLAPHGSQASRIASVIERVGAYTCQTAPERRARIASLLEPFQEQARAERRLRPAERVQVQIPREGPLWDEIRAAIEDAGVRAGLSVYAGHLLSFYYSVLELSHPEQTWWRDGFADAGVPTSPTAYFHNDHSFNVFKAMLYIGDVTETNGPFEFLPGSHRWQQSTTAALLVKSMDRAHAATWGAQGSARAYYRPHFESPEFREQFMRLPSTLAQTSHFGDDLIAGSALAAQIDQERVTCLSATQDCVAFDGNALVHRGGLVQQGERWAIQLGFRESPPEPAPEPVREKQRKRRGPLRRAETYVRHFLRGPEPVAATAAASEEPVRGPDLDAQRDAARRALAGTRLVAADVGAAKGLQSHWAPFEGVAQLYAFEPDQEDFDALQQEFARKPHAELYHPLRVALSGTGGPRTLHLFQPSTSSSLLPVNLEQDAPTSAYLFPDSMYPAGEAIIDTRTFADVLDEHAEDAVHLAKLDVQGAEIEVLEGLGAERLDKLLLLEAEVNTFEVYKGQPSLADFHVFCSDHGLELFDSRPQRSHVSRDGREAGYQREVFGVEPDCADITARIWHFDMVYLRSKERLIAAGDPDQIRRQVVAFCGYGFFAEAYQLVERAQARGLFDTQAADDLKGAIEAWFRAARHG